MVGNEAANQSLIAKKGAEFYLKAERDILALFEDAPDDVREALIEMIKDLHVDDDSLPPLPQPPKLVGKVKGARREDVEE